MAASARPTPAESQAFREALLRSEVRRAYAVVAVLGVAMLPVLPQLSAPGSDSAIRVIAVLAVILLLSVQFAAIAVARWCRRRARDMPASFVTCTVLIESLMPTGVILTHIQLGTLAPYAALSSPPAIAYGLLIGLTTLRMRPALCVLAGAAGALSFWALVLYVRHGLGFEQPTTGLPQAAYMAAPILILMTGLAAAWVAREIRGYVAAALREAESRRRADQMEQDLSIAQSIQQALLPRQGPALAAYDIAGWNQPADQTGGDYYDWQQLPDGNWIITLADVSGHGVGPAMVTAACRAYMRASTAHHHDLQSLASRVNELLAHDLPDGRFVTMASVLLSPQGPVGLLSAGHGPIVLYVKSTGETRDMPPQDVPLAVLPDRAYAAAESITLAPGDLLALVTDGFVEWSKPAPQGGREQFGLPRLRDSLRRHAKLPASELIQAVAAEVTRFAAGERQQDDLTMVVIRRTA